MDYLKDKQEYIDRHDLGTIEECIDWYRSLRSGFEKDRKNGKFKEDTDEEFDEEVNKILNLTISTIKEERYRDKDKTIEEWTERDRMLQDKQDNTPEPRDIRCLVCDGETKLTSRDLQDTYEKKPYVLFMYECTKCQKRRVVYEDGREWVHEEPRCPKCKGILKTNIEFGENITTFTETCSKCSYKNVDIHDHKKFQTEHEAKEKKDKALLEKFRGEFCLSEEEGKKMVDLYYAMAFGNEVYEYEKSKYDDPTFEKAAKLSKIGISELEKLLGETLAKENYVKLSTDKPEIDRYVIVPFNLQDGDTNRNKHNNLYDMEKLIKKTVETTNWRLMNGSLTSRLGFISGRLKGYEQEEDFLEISGYKKEEEKKKPDPVKWEKYRYNNIVQLSQIIGKHAGIENMRKRRLAKEPEGFFLEATEGPYNCAICGESTPGEKTWWTENALWCADCWRNVKEGTIPPLTWDHKNKIWIHEWEIKSEYSIQPMTRKKLEREGILHPRNIKKEDGRTYCSVYLVKENEDFLKKYPKKPENDIKITWSEEKKSLMLDVKKNEY